MTIYVVILVIMILRYAPRSYLLGWDISVEEEEEVEVEQEPAQGQTATNDRDRVSEGEEKGLLCEDSLIKMRFEKEIDEDTEEDEAMDKVPSMRNSSSHGALESVGRPSPRPKPTRQSSTRMLKSRSTGSLQKSLRAQVPTFGE